MNTTTIIGTDEVATTCGVKPVTVRYWRMRGTGPAYVMVSGRACYDLAEVEAYAKLRQETA